MSLNPELIRGMHAYGFVRPSALHQRAIVPIVKGHDAIIQTSSELDQTSLLAISGLQKVDSSVKSTQVLIITSTRELVSAIQNVVNALGTNLNIECQTCNVRDDTTNLQNAYVVAGTLGRVYELLKRRSLVSEKIKLLCIHEADEILSRGLKDHLNEVFHYLPQDIQVIIISATMPMDVLEISQKFLRDPVQVRLSEKADPSFDGVRQYYIAVEREEWKLDTVCDLFKTLAARQVIIFCNTRRKVDWLNEKMHAHKFTVSALVVTCLVDLLRGTDLNNVIQHADMGQKQREALIKEFQQGSSHILIATDVLARGLDVRGPPVINYDLPANKENYVHRITRNNVKRSGIAINFVTTDDMRGLRDIEQFYHTQIDEMPMSVA
ncbi:hypothetical protein H0H92_010070 [Tricholoma furcatifolium]|nr:hypothetical protein H0H92_010070 [Tricholoma furcatifolium]